MVMQIQRRRGPAGFHVGQERYSWPSDVTEEMKVRWKREYDTIWASKNVFNKWDHMYMEFAVRASEESKCPRKKVGCCILLESGMLAIGLNGFPEGMEEQWNDGSESNPLVTHAELNALGKLLEEGVSCKNATVYITLSPCVECSKLLVRAKVNRVVYLEEYRCTEGLRYLRKYGVEVEQIKSKE